MLVGFDSFAAWGGRIVGPLIVARRWKRTAAAGNPAR
jgi:hypothetical protein